MFRRPSTANLYFYRTFLHKQTECVIIRKGSLEPPSFLPPTRKILVAAIRKDKELPFSSLNYFVLLTISFAQRAARSSSPSLSGPSVPSTKKPSGDPMRVPPFFFRVPAILGAA